jgi:hypothetical protein
MQERLGEVTGDIRTNVDEAGRRAQAGMKDVRGEVQKTEDRVKGQE